MVGKLVILEKYDRFFYQKRRVDALEEHLVICKWEQIDDWAKWLISEPRMGFQERIDALIDSKTRFEIYE